MRRPRLVSTSAAACCARHARAKRAPRKQLSLPLSLFAIPFAAQAKSCTNLRRSTRRATAPAVASCTSLRASSYSSICARSTTSGASRAVVGSQSKLANRAGLHCMPSQAPRSREVALCLPSGTRQLSSRSKVMPMASAREKPTRLRSQRTRMSSARVQLMRLRSQLLRTRPQARHQRMHRVSRLQQAPVRLKGRQIACNGVNLPARASVHRLPQASVRLQRRLPRLQRRQHQPTLSRRSRASDRLRRASLRLQRRHLRSQERHLRLQRRHWQMGICLAGYASFPRNLSRPLEHPYDC